MKKKKWKEYRARVGKEHTENCLKDLQNEIENLCLSYEEKSVYQCQPGLMKMFINSELPSAKEYLQGKFKVDKSSDTPSRIKIIPKSNDDNANDDNAKGYKNILSPEDMEMLSVFGPYTIEWILINVLSSLFSIESSVRCASVIERIESLVRHNGNKMMEKAANKKKSKNLISYPFGTALIEFLIERGLIDLKVLDTSVKNNTDVKVITIVPAVSTLSVNSTLLFFQ